MTLTTHARLEGVKVMRDGVPHKDDPTRLWTRAEIEAMLRDTNAALPYLRETFGLTAYPENEDLLDMAGQPIPSFLNLNHNTELADTIRNATRDVTVAYDLLDAEDGLWIVANYENVSPDIAHYLQDRYFGRSVEILPQLRINGELKQNVIRSVGFLSPEIAPHVPDASQPDFVVRQAAPHGVVTIAHSLTIPQPPQTSEETAEVTPMTEQDVQQYQAQLAEKDKALREAEAAREQAEAVLHERETKLHQQAVTHYCEHMAAQRIAPAIITPIKALLDKLPDSVILQDDQQPLNEHVQALLTVILQAAAEGTLFTPPEDAELLPRGQTPPAPSPQTYSAAELRQAAETRARRANPHASDYDIAREMYVLNARAQQGGPTQ